MPVYKDGKKYVVRYYATDPLTGKRKQIKKRGFQTRREAVKWEAEESLKTTVSSTSMTFWDVFQIQLNNNDTSKTTRKKKEAWISMYFKEYKDLSLEKITKPMLVEWRNNLKNSGLAVRTMNSGLQYVRSVFAFYSTVYGGLNVGSALKSFKLSKKDKTEMKIWTPDEFYQFLDAIKNPVYRDYYTFLFWTGCRRGEGIALTKDCFMGNKVHIYQSMKHFKDGFKPLKTDSSERVITIDSKLMEMLTPRINAADPFVFGGTHPMPISKVYSNFKKGIKDSGVKPIRLHDLRHSHASFLLNNGANILAVSKRLGHATVTQTLDTYAHLLEETDDKMMQIIEDTKSKIQTK